MSNRRSIQSILSSAATLVVLVAGAMMMANRLSEDSPAREFLLPAILVGIGALRIFDRFRAGTERRNRGKT